MSGRLTREARAPEPRRGDGRGEQRSGQRALLPLLDRLIDDSPDDLRDPVLSTAEAMAALRRSVRRDLEALLNARRRWASWPSELRHIAQSPVGFGIPDFTSGAFNDVRRREALRHDIEQTIRRFEPRLASVQVSLIESANKLEATLRLRIDGLLHAHPAPEPIAFDTMVDATTADVFLKAATDV